MGQLLFDRDITLPIKHMADRELTRQKNLTKNNKENIHKNIKRVDHDYKVDDKVMLYNNYDFKYEVTHKGQFDINQC